MGIPNLDDCSDHERAAAITTFRQLVAYAKRRTMAAKFRWNGHVQLALDTEKQMELIYKALPKWARW